MRNLNVSQAERFQDRPDDAVSPRPGALAAVHHDETFRESEATVYRPTALTIVLAPTWMALESRARESMAAAGLVGRSE